MTHVSFPFALTPAGATAAAGDAAYLRQLLEQLLFTGPGERVNRPDFGCGLNTATFEPAAVERLPVLEAVIKANIGQWLGDLVRLVDVTAEVRDATLTVTVQYADRRTGVGHADVFVREARP